MEQRQIIIMDSSSNKKVVVNTDATTFGDLKAAARAAGISYEGKDWLEGLTKNSPMSDDSLLPTNVKYVPKEGPNAGKEIVTNNLVYMLTNTNKRIKSGMNRTEVYAEIKKYNLQEAVKAKYGKNFTQVSTDNLIQVVTAHTENSVQKASCKKSAVENLRNEMENKKTVNWQEKYEKVVTAVASFLSLLPTEVVDDAAKAVSKLPNKQATEVVEFSDADIKRMFSK